MSFLWLYILLPVIILGKDYQYWCSGNCDSPVTTKPHSGIILMGGGTDVDDAFKQQINWSDCGDFLVIRASGTDAYNDYIMSLGCANSASTILINNKNGANDDFVISKINASEAIFFAGGNQATYLSEWIGTKLQSAVEYAINYRNVPVGGTSAGCDIQSYYVYSASNGSVYSDEALENPYNKYMTFSNFFELQKNNILNNTIMDTHFITRDRFGRLLTFVARMETDSEWGKGRPIKGIGINEQTAIAIDLDTGIGTLLGPNKYCSEAYIIIPNDPPSVCKPNTPLTYENVNIVRLQAYYKDTFNFIDWKGGTRDNNYKISANKGRLTVDPYNSPSCLA